MKPISINLGQVKKPARLTISAVAAVVACIALGLGAATVYEYLSNEQVIHEYQARMTTMEHRAEQDRHAAAGRSAADRETLARTRMELDYLTGRVRKSLFPVMDILTALEKRKPDLLEITELVFSDSLNQVTIRAVSSHASSVSGFLAAMGTADRFTANLTRKQIDEDNTIALELAVEWTGRKGP